MLKMISSFLMLVLLPSTLAQASFCPSATDTVHFELVTGKVFTSPEDMLDSRPGTLMLTDCIDLCRCDLNLLLVNLHLKYQSQGLKEDLQVKFDLSSSQL